MKSWSGEIRQHVARWTSLCGRRNIKWWSRLAYHVTDVHNAANILSQGALLSRELAVSSGWMVNENASTTVISVTPDQHKTFARLYFRPRTPTQYRNEGIRALEHRYQGAHCPVPVFLCFDLEALLVQDHVLFSSGSMGRPEVEYGDSLALFRSIPFEYVYHDRAIRPDEDKAEIVFRRHAEILVPDRLPLDHLAGVACRSNAERQTLLHMLGPRASKLWQRRIVQAGDALFFRNWPHLVSVTGIDDTLHLQLASVSRAGTVPLSVDVTELGTGRRWVWEGESRSAQLSLELGNARKSRVTIEIHGCVAFRGIVGFQDDLPF